MEFGLYLYLIIYGVIDNDRMSQQIHLDNKCNFLADITA